MPHKPKILIIDDDLALLAALPDMLAFHLDGAEVEVIACPVEAVQRVQGSRHDLVICDLAMPRMDGIAVLTHLHISNPTTICILMTGHWNKEIQTKAQQAGAFACVPKPLERKTFIDTIRQALATAVCLSLTHNNAAPDSNVSTPSSPDYLWYISKNESLRLDGGVHHKDFGNSAGVYELPSFRSAASTTAGRQRRRRMIHGRPATA